MIHADESRKSLRIIEFSDCAARAGLEARVSMWDIDAQSLSRKGRVLTWDRQDFGPEKVASMSQSAADRVCGFWEQNAIEFNPARILLYRGIVARWASMPDLRRKARSPKSPCGLRRATPLFPGTAIIGGYRSMTNFPVVLSPLFGAVSLEEPPIMAIALFSIALVPKPATLCRRWEKFWRSRQSWRPRFLGPRSR